MCYSLQGERVDDRQLFGCQVQSTNVTEPIALLAAIELSKTTWLLAILDAISNKVSRRRADGEMLMR
jgi:hypothetical protein